MPTNPNTCTVDGCPGGNRTILGMCKKHYRQSKTPRRKTRLTTLTELIAIKTDECTPWPHGGSNNGYGRITANGRPIGVHAYSCETAHGPRPPGYQTAHACNNRGCVNPRHLRWATPKENNADKRLHGTSQRGERNNTNKLRTEQVQEIKRALTAGGTTHSSLAKQYDVHKSAIHHIASGKNWGWLNTNDDTPTTNP